ncbi:MAG: hypothetical protein IJT21_10810 [Synergistaceae bacterium]|nr:hypothetical protein [Synergistaceae bacterium]
MTINDIPDIVQEILSKNKRPFMTVKNLAVVMGAEAKRLTGINTQMTAAEIRKILEPLVMDKFIFHKKGPTLYILQPCEPEDLVIAEINNAKIKSAKWIARSLPFSKSDVAKIINSFVESGRAKIIINDNLDARIYLTDTPAIKTQPAKIEPESEPEPEKISTPSTDYSREEFMRAFESLDNGRVFVRICDLRKKLNWPRDLFDAILMMLRDKELIQLHIADESTMSPDEVKDSFIDENNYRMGTVTKNVR